MKIKIELGSEDERGGEREKEGSEREKREIEAKEGEGACGTQQR